MGREVFVIQARTLDACNIHTAQEGLKGLDCPLEKAHSKLLKNSVTSLAENSYPTKASVVQAQTKGPLAEQLVMIFQNSRKSLQSSPNI